MCFETILILTFNVDYVFCRMMTTMITERKVAKAVTERKAAKAVTERKAAKAQAVVAAMITMASQRQPHQNQS
jgi:Na+-transporting methylmalonyl-CoA/oxaloacetate decarboxylase gamma subunit